MLCKTSRRLAAVNDQRLQRTHSVYNAHTALVAYHILSRPTGTYSSETRDVLGLNLDPFRIRDVGL